MGATPHTVMLAVHCKRGEATDIKGPVRKYVHTNYGEHSAEECNDDLEAMQGWRTSMIGQNASPEHLLDILAKYFRALCAMEARFPVSKDKEHVNISFSWYDAFKPNKKTTQANLHLEKAATLFNIAATLSQMAISANRSDPQGVKDACKYFQETAGAFLYLKDHVSLKVEHPRPTDITPECTSMLEKLMLAQAQEIFFEKAIADGKSLPVVAKLGKQTAILYEEVYRALTSNATLATHFDKSWLTHTLGKSQYYDIQASYRQSLAHHEKEEIGLAIAFVRQGLRIMDDAKKNAKAVHQDMADNLKMLEKECMLNLSKYEKENNTVYLERVPAADNVPSIVGAQLVKATSPSFLTDIKGTDLFTSVVPESSTKALSKYTDMVDKVYREALDKLAQSSDDARIRLREWELPDLLIALDSGSAAGLPDNLRAELEELGEHNGSFSHLEDILKQVGDCRAQAQNGLAHAEELMKNEAKEDKALREQYKERWTRPPSETLTTTLWERIAGYRANLQQAAASDAKIQEKMESNKDKLSGLTLEAASTNMPRLQAPMMSVDDMEPATVVSNLRQALQQLDAVGAQRAQIEESLKELKAKDDILPKLMAGASDYEALFAREIAKYDPLREQTAKNCALQAQVMAVLGNNHQKFMAMYGVADWRAACSNAAGDVRKTMGLYKELRDNLSEGLRFYLQLQEVIGSLVQHCGDFCLTRRIQRDDLIEEFRRQNDQASQAEADRLAAMRLRDQPNGPHDSGPPPGQMYPPPSGHAPPPPYPGVQPPTGYNPYQPVPLPHQPPPPNHQHYYHQPPPQYPPQPGPPQPAYTYHNPYRAGQSGGAPSSGGNPTSNPMFNKQ